MLNSRHRVVAVAAFFALSASSLFAAISISTSTAYTQNFDGIGTAATAALPADFKVDKNTTARTVGAFTAAGTATAIVGGANLSTSASNGIYNFGSGTGTTGSDRAVGFLSSSGGTASGNIYTHLVNNTGGSLSALAISYDVEKYRSGSNAAGFSIQLYYSMDGSTWTSAGSNFLTSIPGADAGNTGFSPAPGLTVAVNKTLAVTIPDGSDFYLAWNYSVTSGTTFTNSQALAVDDISILGSNAPTNPSGSGTATPSTVPAGNSTTLSATVAPGTNPASTGLTVSCDLTGIGGSATFALPGPGFSAAYVIPGGTALNNYSLPCTISDDQARSAIFNISLTVTAPFTCGGPVTAIHAIQGSGSDSLLNGQVVTVEGIVVGSFQAANQLHGFYLQEPDGNWDSDPSTSEGIFIFDNGAGPVVNIGDRVRVQGTVSEFSGSGSFLGTTLTSHLTEIGSLTGESVCSTGNTFTRTNITLPVTNSYVAGTPSWNPDLERYEGMAVQMNQQLTVTGNFSLGTFGQIDVAPSLQYTPTAFVGNSTTWKAATDLVQRSVIAIDDDSTLSNASLYPTLFPAPGLSDSNTLRSGDLVNYNSVSHSNDPLIGVLDDRFGEYRIQPTTVPSFFSANPRPAIAPILTSIGGRFRAVSANVLNFFTTLGSRGAFNSTEFNHQKTKVIEALYGMNGDVYGLSEVQNFANGQTSGGTYTNAALQSLVDGLNCRFAGQDALCASPPAGPYALIDTVGLGTDNGTDAIRAAMIYRTDRVTTVGSPVENPSLPFGNRPTLAQTFQPAAGNKAAQQTFTFVVNHFRSKGSSCGVGDDDTFQGTCNGTRLTAAQTIVTWLGMNPTADPAGANRRLLVVGDFNAYYGEDPIQWFGSHGYLNLIHSIIGDSAYSYNFGSEAGYLDHAFANPTMNPLVKKVAEWHNNADEPSSLQALDSDLKSAAAQVAYYGADPYAASDHDPIVIGFNTLIGDLNDDGVVDSADQALLSANVGKTAAQASDRRMDYDGDGKISLNDYKLWQSYYKAYIQ